MQFTRNFPFTPDIEIASAKGRSAASLSCSSHFIMFVNCVCHCVPESDVLKTGCQCFDFDVLCKDRHQVGMLKRATQLPHMNEKY